MSDERLAEIKARVEAATPGPWERNNLAGRPEREVFAGDYLIGDFGVGGWKDDEGADRVEINADFIAHARQDIPGLLAEVQRLREHVASLEQGYKDSRERIREMESGVMF